MDWNPETKSYCRGCPYYRPVGTYIYELERDPKMCKCRHLAHCRRVAAIIKGSMTNNGEHSDNNKVVNRQKKKLNDESHSTYQQVLFFE